MSPTLAGLLQAGLLIAALAAVHRPLGDYLARVFSTPEHTRAETALYRLVRVDPDAEQRWGTYAQGVLGFSFVSVVLLYLLSLIHICNPCCRSTSAAARCRRGWRSTTPRASCPTRTGSPTCPRS